MKQILVLRGDLLLPEVVSLPPMSLKGARQFFLKLTTQGIPYYRLTRSNWSTVVLSFQTSRG